MALQWCQTQFHSPILWSVTHRAHQLGKDALAKRVFPGQYPIAALLPQLCSSGKEPAGTGKVLKTAAPQSKDQPPFIPPGEDTQVSTCLDVMIWGSQKSKSHIIFAVAGLGHDSSMTLDTFFQYLP